ncbi:uncharacterized protein MONBRDRAFT_33671 [Monosiga brevicollis MX1]|uniref:DAGKc domain-containing protein n=1 Tax=Monosiga brevicollis TaxID=81824 RepID=A9V6H3_MONBE|nr:uncharacterized protein MONBRDRAFT_33671 [Monosiga brevicollis MX1]EDQ86807.1 predicted protein [Monosiga brevicollis MX1]|eukprot:XP_001748352.1 hypothetical protein [Monosiga brevicollis MX1]
MASATTTSPTAAPTAAPAAADEAPLLQDEFEHHGQTVSVVLTRTAIELRSTSRPGSSGRLPLEEVYGTAIVERNAQRFGLELFRLHAKKEGGKAKQLRVRDRFCSSDPSPLRARHPPEPVPHICVLQSLLESTDRTKLENWSTVIRRHAACQQENGHPRHLLVLVNPYGGTKRAPKIYTRHVKPMLDRAGIRHTMRHTEHACHAIEIGATLDLALYTGIVVVSGDGLLNEMINGLLHRDDWEAAAQIPIGIIPAGSGNGLAWCLGHFQVEKAVFHLIKGHTTPLDIFRAWQGPKVHYGFLCLHHGLIADVDIESEQYRWAGAARFTLSGVRRLLGLRRYPTRVWYQPAAAYDENRLPATARTLPEDDVDAANAAANPKIRSRCPVSQLERYPASARLPDDPASHGWKLFDGESSIALALNAPWTALLRHGSTLCNTSSRRFTPPNHTALIMWRGGSWCICFRLHKRLIGPFLEPEKAAHIGKPWTRYVLVKNAIFEFADDRGVLNMDGEVLPHVTTAMDMMPSVMRIYSMQDVPLPAEDPANVPPGGMFCEPDELTPARADQARSVGSC